MPKPLSCAACSAPLPGPDANGVLTCTYCGQTHGQPRQTVKIQVGSAPGAGLGVLSGLLGVGVSAFVVCAGAVGAWWPATQTGGPLSSPAGLPTIAALPTGERLMWDRVNSPPQLVRLGDRTLLVTRGRTQPDDQLHTIAWDLKDGTIAWRAGPWGTYSEGYQSTRLASLPGTIAVSDLHGVVHLLDPADGTERASARLTDRVSGLCARDGRLRAEQVDQRVVWIDAAGAVTEAPAKPRCEERPTAPKAPLLPGFAPRLVWSTADGTVAVGHKSPGTPTPKAAAWQGEALRWEGWIPTADLATVREERDAPADLHGRRLVAVYGPGSDGWAITALDADSGARLWDKPLRRVFAVDWIKEVWQTDDRVIVGRMSHLDLLDAATGEPVATMGEVTWR